MTRNNGSLRVYRKLSERMLTRISGKIETWFAISGGVSIFLPIVVPDPAILAGRSMPPGLISGLGGQTRHSRDPGGVGILGGTFDPIHYGHLRMADEVGAALGLAQVRLIPAGNPYHRPADASQTPRLQRLAMARLGVVEFPRLTVDPREALRPEPSYTIDTLTGLREELGSTPILLLLGADTFATLPTWKRWLELFGLAPYSGGCTAWL